MGEEVEDYGVEEVGDAAEGEEVREGEVGEDMFVDFGGEDSHLPQRVVLDVEEERGGVWLEGGGTRLLLGWDDRLRDKAAFHPSQSRNPQGLGVCRL